MYFYLPALPGGGEDRGRRADVRHAGGAVTPGRPGVRHVPVPAGRGRAAADRRSLAGAEAVPQHVRAHRLLGPAAGRTGAAHPRE